jgi:hypothetical protein
MTKPLTISAVKKAESLIRERDRIAGENWNAVGHKACVDYGGISRLEAVDEQLQWAIEEFRKRKLDAIDSELVDLGVNPSESADAA